MASRQLRRQLRPALRLRRGLHDALIAHLLTASQGRRALHLMQLVEDGLRAEQLDVLLPDCGMDESIARTVAVDVDLKISLRINKNRHVEIYQALASVPNWTERLRQLAIKGLHYRMYLKNGTSPISAPVAKPSSTATSQAKRLMASMMAALTEEGD